KYSQKRHGLSSTRAIVLSCTAARKRGILACPLPIKQKTGREEWMKSDELLRTQPQPAPSSPDLAPPLVTVVIPAYNEARRLPTTLARVSEYLDAQNYPYELLVVDDGSADDTAALAEQFMERNPRVRVIRNPHKGKGVTVRAGMLAA